MTVSYTLTKRVDKGVFALELEAAGLLPFNIDNEKVYLTGDLTEQAKVSRLAKVAQVEAAHIPLSFTEVVVPAAPHPRLLASELAAINVSGIGLEHPFFYPGIVVVLHNPVSPSEKGAIQAVVEAHDSTAFPKLTVDTSSVVVCPPMG